MNMGVFWEEYLYEQVKGVALHADEYDRKPYPWRGLVLNGATLPDTGIFPVPIWHPKYKMQIGAIPKRDDQFVELEREKLLEDSDKAYRAGQLDDVHADMQRRLSYNNKGGSRFDHDGTILSKEAFEKRNPHLKPKSAEELQKEEELKTKQKKGKTGADTEEKATVRSDTVAFLAKTGVDDEIAAVVAATKKATKKANPGTKAAPSAKARTLLGEKRGINDGLDWRSRAQKARRVGSMHAYYREVRQYSNQFADDIGASTMKSDDLQKLKEKLTKFVKEDVCKYWPDPTGRASLSAEGVAQKNRLQLYSVYVEGVMNVIDVYGLSDRKEELGRMKGSYLFQLLTTYMNMEINDATYGDQDTLEKTKPANCIYIRCINRYTIDFVDAEMYAEAAALLSKTADSTADAPLTLKALEFGKDKDSTLAQYDICFETSVHIMGDKERGMHFLLWLKAVKDTKCLPQSVLKDELNPILNVTRGALEGVSAISHPDKHVRAVEGTGKLVRQFCSLPLGALLKSQFQDQLSRVTRASDGANELQMLVIDSEGGLHAAGMKSGKFAKLVELAKKYRDGSATVIQALPKDERTAFQEENKDCLGKISAVYGDVCKEMQASVGVSFVNHFEMAWKPMLDGHVESVPVAKLVQKIKDCQEMLKKASEGLPTQDKVQEAMDECKCQAWVAGTQKVAVFLKAMQVAPAFIHIDKLPTENQPTIEEIETLTSELKKYATSVDSEFSLCSLLALGASHDGKLDRENKLVKSFLSVWNRVSPLVKVASVQYFDKTRQSFASKTSFKTLMTVHHAFKLMDGKTDGQDSGTYPSTPLSLVPSDISLY